MTEKLKINEAKITLLESKFNDFKKHVDSRFDLVMEQLKPRFTDKQIWVFLFGLMCSLVSIMVYVTDGKSDTRNNTTRIDHIEKMDEIKFGKLDEIINTLGGIKTDVEVLKSKNIN